MSKELSCAVVRDLLPSYMDRLTSEETNVLMEEHFAGCGDCSGERDRMRRELAVEAPASPGSAASAETHDFKRFLRRTKLMYVTRGILWSLGVLAVVVSVIVDLAVSKKLTWSIIVDISIVYAYLCAVPAFYSKKHKVLGTLGVASVLLLPMLWGFERVINANFMQPPYYWFRQYALPISLTWLAVVWCALLVRRLAHLNVWTTLGLLMLLAVPASAYTNMVANGVGLLELYTAGFEWISTLCYLASAVVLFIVGIRRGKKGKA